MSCALASRRCNCLVFVDESGEEPTWNFWKYVISVEGHVVGAYPPTESVADVMNQVRIEKLKMTDTDRVVHDVKRMVEQGNRERGTKWKVSEL